MSGSLFDFTFGREEEKADKKLQGIAFAEVIGNIDSLGEGRVRLRLPWMPGVEPWARVANLAGGAGTGTYLQPQVGNEVVVAFNQGDITEPVVLGVLYSTTDRPPTVNPAHAINKWILRTPLGHELEFDDALGTITLTTITRQKVTLGLDGVEISSGEGGARLTLGAMGDVTLSSPGAMRIEATNLELSATNLRLTGTVNAELSGGANCAITGGMVRIN